SPHLLDVVVHLSTKRSEAELLSPQTDKLVSERPGEKMRGGRGQDLARRPPEPQPPTSVLRTRSGSPGWAPAQASPRTINRNPMWLVPLSSCWGERAAGR